MFGEDVAMGHNLSIRLINADCNCPSARRLLLASRRRAKPRGVHRDPHAATGCEDISGSRIVLSPDCASTKNTA